MYCTVVLRVNGHQRDRFEILPHNLPAAGRALGKLCDAIPDAYISVTVTTPDGLTHIIANKSAAP